MDVLMEYCCGLGIHRDMVEACILYRTESESQAIRNQFQTMRRALSRLTTWLHDSGCRHIAVESTVVYWRPVYETIKAQSPGDDCLMVVTAHHMRNLPRRKSDVKESCRPRRCAPIHCAAKSSFVNTKELSSMCLAGNMV